MKIIYAHAPSMTSTILFADFPKQKVKEAKRIIVEFHFHTKTRIGISFRHEQSTVSVNFVPLTSAQYKFHAERGMNMFSGNTSTRYYFILSKKQHLQALEEHVKNVVCEVFSVTKDDDFDIVFWVSTCLRQLGATVPEEKQDLSKVS
jgi:hypothetical protein